MKEGLSRKFAAAGVVGTLALTGCSVEISSVPSNPTPSVSTSEVAPSYLLHRDAQGRLIDQGIQKRPERGVTAVTLFYDPTTEKGSIQAEVCFDGATKFRVMSHETSPRPGWLVNAPFEVQGPACVVKRPVIELGPQDQERVYIGVGNTPRSTYEGMLVYDVKSNGFNPQVKRIPNESAPINPKLRG